MEPLEPMHPYFYLSLAILSEVIGTTALKLSDGFTRPLPAAVTVIGYVLAFYLLSLTLRGMALGIAYAVWAGVGIVLITLVGVVLFHQTLDGPALFGLALIVAGVVIIHLFSKSIAP